MGGSARGGEDIAGRVRTAVEFLAQVDEGIGAEGAFLRGVYDQLGNLVDLGAEDEMRARGGGEPVAEHYCDRWSAERRSQARLPAAEARIVRRYAGTLGPTKVRVLRRIPDPEFRLAAMEVVGRADLPRSVVELMQQWHYDGAGRRLSVADFLEELLARPDALSRAVRGRIQHLLRTRT